MCVNTTDSKPIADLQSADVFDCVLEQALCLYMLGSYAPCSFCMDADSTIIFTFAYYCVCVCVCVCVYIYIYIYVFFQVIVSLIIACTIVGNGHLFEISIS
jgi:hypothetical protein